MTPNSLAQQKHKETLQQIEGTEPYIKHIRPNFVCPGCGFRKSEKKGYLARLNINSDVALYCKPCIEDMELIVEPEEKERRS